MMIAPFITSFFIILREGFEILLISTLIFRSTAAYVIEHVEMPVLVVPMINK